MRGLYAETHTHSGDLICFVNPPIIQYSNINSSAFTNTIYTEILLNMAGRFTARYMNLKRFIPETRISSLEFGNNKMLRRIVIQWAKDLGKPQYFFWAEIQGLMSTSCCVKWWLLKHVLELSKWCLMSGWTIRWSVDSAPGVILVYRSIFLLGPSGFQVFVCMWRVGMAI